MWLALALLSTAHPCNDDDLARRYAAGHASGRGIVYIALRNFGCEHEEPMQDVLVGVVRRVSAYRIEGLHAQCRYSGFVDGVMQAMGDLSVYCLDSCFANGETIGRLAAHAYCTLGTEAEDYVRGPVATCGLSYELGCDVSFMVGTAACSGEPEGWNRYRARHCAWSAPREE